MGAKDVPTGCSGWLPLTALTKRCHIMRGLAARLAFPESTCCVDDVPLSGIEDNLTRLRAVHDVSSESLVLSYIYLRRATLGGLLDFHVTDAASWCWLLFVCIMVAVKYHDGYDDDEYRSNTDWALLAGIILKQ